MLSDDKMSIVEELLNYSEDIRNSFNKLMEYEIDKREGKYVDESIALDNLLYKENLFYEKISKNNLYRLIIELDDNELIDKLESNLDKFYNITRLENYYSNLSFFRMLNIIRDKAILFSRLTPFDDTELIDEDEMDNYYDKLFNTNIIEFQLFNDLLSLFIANLNETIKIVSDTELKKDLIIYKHITAFSFGKNDISLINRNKNIENSHIYSKLLNDLLEKSDKHIMYNYDIIKSHYLDKALYTFINNLESKPKLINKYINSCYAKAILALYADDYQKATKLYFNEKKDHYDTTMLDTIFNNPKNIISKTKILTLNK